MTENAAKTKEKATATKDEAKPKSKTKAKAKPRAAASSSTKYVYVTVYNNMRCGWIMPRGLLNCALKAANDQKLSDNVLYSKKARIAPMGSVKFEKQDFDAYMQASVSIRNFVETNCLLVIGEKDNPDPRDSVDAPHKVEPSETDMRTGDGQPLSVIQTEAMELKVNKSRQLKAK